MVKSFEELVQEYAIQGDHISSLPFCHTTTVGFLLSILRHGLESKKPCKEYNELLLYFFYGKPSYITEDEVENFSQNPPITLIYEISPPDSSKIKRLLPFDSGGYTRYKMPQGFTRELYSIENNKGSTTETTALDMLKGMIKLIYKTNEQYLQNTADLQNLDKHKHECLEIQYLIDLYCRAKKGEIPVAQQVFSLEMQYEQKLQNKPKYIIIPYEYYTTPYWDNYRNTLPANTIQHYGEKETLSNAGQVLTGSEYMRLMKEKVMSLIKQICQKN